MLKTRMSKCADVNGDNVVVVVVVEDGDNESSAIQPTRDLLPGEPELSHNSGDATTTDHSQYAVLEETLAIALESSVPAIADTVDTASAEPAVISEMLQKDKEEEAPANGAAEECNIITVAAIASDEPLAPASSDAPPLLETTTPETFPQQNDGGAAAAADTAIAAAADDSQPPPPPPPPPTRPPIYHRHIDRRSSRILEGITRKVQHVRQTTSMVLRRSVGSRVSMRPATPHDVFQGSIIGLAGLRGCGLNDSEPEHKPQSDGSETQTQLPPQYSVSDGGPASIKPDDSTSAVGSDGSGVDANSASAELPPHAADRINELEEKLIDVAAARSTTAVNTSDDHTLNATSDKLNSNSNSISRKLFSVRHGTNAAVRNSVTRVKNIFTAKRSVAA
ncbi:hypothetical protein GGH95_002905 [Coemansia sp. RSA 1836]|nr:hypothetical protein GGH95_002905 [Coemansia sp. RSA 1836]